MRATRLLGPLSAAALCLSLLPVAAGPSHDHASPTPVPTSTPHGHGEDPSSSPPPHDHDPGHDHDAALLRSQLLAARRATAKYRDVARANEDGYVQILRYIPVHGVHFLNEDLADDGVFDPAKPEGLLYLPRSDGSLRLVGVFYLQPAYLTDEVPEGFEGSMDHWHYHPWLCIYEDLYVTQNVERELCEAGGGSWSERAGYLVHAWVHSRNPHGVFAEENPRAIMRAQTLSGRGPAALLRLTSKNCRVNIYAELLDRRGIHDVRAELHVGTYTTSFPLPLVMSGMRSVTVDGISFPVPASTPLGLPITVHVHMRDASGQVVATAEDHISLFCTP